MHINNQYRYFIKLELNIVNDTKTQAYSYSIIFTTLGNRYNSIGTYTRDTTLLTACLLIADCCSITLQQLDRVWWCVEVWRLPNQLYTVVWCHGAHVYTLTLA